MNYIFVNFKEYMYFIDALHFIKIEINNIENTLVYNIFEIVVELEY